MPRPPGWCQALCSSLKLPSGTQDDHDATQATHPEQIIRKLAEGQRLLGGGAAVADVCRKFEIAESTWARWLNQYGGMKADDAKRLIELEGRTPSSSGCSPRRSWTRRCSRGSPREHGDPGPETGGRGPAGRRVRGVRTGRLQGRWPVTLDPTSSRNHGGRARRAADATSQSAGSRPRPCPPPHRRPRMQTDRDIVRLRDNDASVGDVIVTRRNARTLRTTDAATIALPADYVRAHVALGYATTSPPCTGRHGRCRPPPDRGWQDPIRASTSP